MAGPLAARFGSRRVLIAGSLVTIVPFTMLAISHDHPWQLYIASALVGIGLGLAFSVRHEGLSAAGADVAIHTEPEGPHPYQDLSAVNPVTVHNLPGQNS